MPVFAKKSPLLKELALMEKYIPLTEIKKLMRKNKFKLIKQIREKIDRKHDTVGMVFELKKQNKIKVSPNKACRVRDGLEYFRGLTFSKEKLKKVISGKDEKNYLALISVSLTSRCNLRCPYCSVNAGRVKPNELSLREQLNLISQAKTLGAKTVAILGTGEPLLDPNLVEIIKFNYENKLITYLFTNATLVDRKIAKFLYTHDVSVSTKMDSLHEETYNKMVGRKGFFNKA